jgi:hypothetical protein
MPLLGIHAVVALQNRERKHLLRVDEAIRDVLGASMVSASANELNAALVGKATVTLLLIAAAREALSSCGPDNSDFDCRAFCDLATEAAAWMLRRSKASDLSMLA